MESTRQFKEGVYFSFIDYSKTLLKLLGMPKYWSLLRNLSHEEEASVRTKFEQNKVVQKKEDECSPICVELIAKVFQE